MDNLTFEQKVALLALSSPQKKAELINRWKSDTEFHFGFNGSKMPLNQFMKQDKFRSAEAYAKHLKNNQRNKGWNRSKTQKHIAEIPAEVFYKRPELNAHLPQKVFSENMRKFLQEYPGFKVSD